MFLAAFFMARRHALSFCSSLRAAFSALMTSLGRFFMPAGRPRRRLMGLPLSSVGTGTMTSVGDGGGASHLPFLGGSLKRYPDLMPET